MDGSHTDVWATFAMAVLAAYLLVGEPLLGRRAWRKLLAALNARIPHARCSFYRQWIWQGWALALATAGITLGLARWTPAQLGLQWPRFPARASAWIQHGGFAGGMLVGVGIALVGGIVAGLIFAARRKGKPPAPAQRATGDNEVLRILPHTRRERLEFAALAVTAGVGEEVVWRGFGIGMLLRLLPQAPVGVPIVLGALAFGLAHLYQGWKGMLGTAVLGGLLALLYVDTASLLIPMALHVAIDLRAALARVPAQAPAAGEGAGGP